MKKEFIELDLGEENPEAYEQSLSREGQTDRKNIFIKRDRPKRETWEIDGIEEIDIDALLGEEGQEDGSEDSSIEEIAGVSETDVTEEEGTSEIQEPKVIEEVSTIQSVSEASLPVEEVSVIEEPETGTEGSVSEEPLPLEEEPIIEKAGGLEDPLERAESEAETEMKSSDEEFSDAPPETNVSMAEESTPDQTPLILEVDPLTGETDTVYTDHFTGGSFTGSEDLHEEALDLGTTGRSFADPVLIVADRPEVVWYLKLPFITVFALIPVIGWLIAGLLLYQRYQKYGYDEQTRELTKAYVLCIVCLIIAGWIIVAVAMLPGRSKPASSQEVSHTFEVAEQAERQAAESHAREEAEKRESEEEQVHLRSSAQANIGLENATVKKPTTAPVIDAEASLEEWAESAQVDETQIAQGQQETEEVSQESKDSLYGSENNSVEEKSVWRSVLDRLTGNDQELDQTFSENAEADMEELQRSGDNVAWYSLPKLASHVTLLTAQYDDRFQGERQAVFAFMSGYQGMEISTQTFNLRTNFIDMFQQTVHWEATLDQTQYRYLGTITDGLPQGMGVVLTISSANPNTYIPLYAGTFVNGSLEGYGMTFRDNGGYYGIVYEGYYSGGKYSGKGTSYVIPSYAGYQGRMQQTDTLGNQYSNEQISGILSEYTMGYNTAMNMYQGDNLLYTYIDVPMLVPIITERGRYEAGNQTGYFVQYGAFGQRNYAGVLKKGVRSGPGISYFTSGQVEYDGEWKNGRYNGKGVLYQEDGTIRYSGEFLNGDIKPVAQ